MPTKILTGSTLHPGIRKTGNVPGDFQARDVMDKVFTIKPWLYPLSQITFLSKPTARECKNVYGKVEWIEDELIWNEDVTTAASDGGANTMTVTVADSNLYTVGRMVRFDTTDQVGKVTSKPTATTIVVTRPMSAGDLFTGGVGTGLASGAKIHLLGSANGENSDPPDAVGNFGVFRSNYPQIHEKTIKMTDRMIAITKAGGTYGGNQWKEQLMKRGEEMRRDIEMSNWFQTESGAVVDSSTGEVTSYTKGVIQAILDGGGTAATYSTTATGITETEIDLIISARKYGSPNATLFGGNAFTASIERAIKNRYSNFNAVERYGAIKGDGVGRGVRFVEYTFGGQVIEVVRNPLWGGKYTHWGVILDLDTVEPICFPPDDKGSRKMRMEDNIQDNKAPRKEAKLLSDSGIIVTKGAVNTVIRPTTYA